MRQRTRRPSRARVAQAHPAGGVPEVVAASALDERRWQRAHAGIGQPVVELFAAHGSAPRYPQSRATSLVGHMHAGETELEELVARALAEDVGAGDVTTAATVPPGTPRAGADHPEAARRRLRRSSRRADLRPRSIRDARLRAPRAARARGASGGPVLERRGRRAAALLTAERTALNFLPRSQRRRDARPRATCAAVAGHRRARSSTRARRRPGLRALEKAAVAAGGGVNHRAGLYDAILDQGEPRRDGRRRGRGRARGARGRARTCRSRSSAARADEVDEALAAGRAAAAARQHGARRSCARSSRSVGGRARARGQRRHRRWRRSGTSRRPA